MISEEKKGNSYQGSYELSKIMGYIRSKNMNFDDIKKAFPEGANLTSNDILDMSSCTDVTGEIFWYFYNKASIKPSYMCIFKYIKNIHGIFPNHFLGKMNVINK
jgi:hypothetical protein